MQVGGQPSWACVLCPEGARSCHPLPCQSQAHVLPAHRAPLSSRQAEVEGTPCQRPGTSLNPHSASTSLSLRQRSGFLSPSLEPTRAGPHPLLLLLWGIWVQPRVGGLSSHPLPPRILAPGPLAQLLPAKKTFVLYLTSHVPCAVSRLSHLCPAFQLVFKSLGCLLGCPPSPRFPSGHVRHFARKSHLGKRQKGQKNKFPLALR